VHFEAVQRKQQLDTLAAEKTRHFAFAAEVEHEKLEECVYDNGLVAVSCCIEL
jgi:hypothetical protein